MKCQINLQTARARQTTNYSRTQGKISTQKRAKLKAIKQQEQQQQQRRLLNTEKNFRSPTHSCSLHLLHFHHNSSSECFSTHRRAFVPPALLFSCSLPLLLLPPPSPSHSSVAFTQFIRRIVLIVARQI